MEINLLAFFSVFFLEKETALPWAILPWARMGFSELKWQSQTSSLQIQQPPACFWRDGGCNSHLPSPSVYLGVLEDTRAERYGEKIHKWKGHRMHRCKDSSCVCRDCISEDSTHEEWCGLHRQWICFTKCSIFRVRLFLKLQTSLSSNF